MQVAQTLDTQLNVFADFDPVLSATPRRDSSVVFLGNIQPEPPAPRARAVHRRRPGRARLDELLDRHRRATRCRTAMRTVDVRPAERRRDPHAHGRAEPTRGGAADPGARPTAVVVKQGELRRVRCSPTTASSSSPATRWRRSSTRRARATRSPAASSATSTATRAGARRPTRCAARAVYGSVSRRSRSRISAASGCSSSRSTRSRRASRTSSA